jgi:hypothetical protein
MDQYISESRLGETMIRGPKEVHQNLYYNSTGAHQVVVHLQVAQLSMEILLTNLPQLRVIKVLKLLDTHLAAAHEEK